MTQPHRFAPPTQLDVLRSLLSDYSETDRSFEPQFDKCLQTLRQQALPLLGRRLARTTTPHGLRSLILRKAATFDWPEWDLHLMQLLQVEEDMALFDEGCSALGGLCTHRALEGLRRLQEFRRDPERQEILQRELAPYEVELPLEVCLGALQEGKGNPILARQGARGLVVRAGPETWPALLEATRQGDALTRHLILRVLIFHPHPALQGALLDLFREAQDDHRDGLFLAEFLPQLKGVARDSAKATLLAKLEERFVARAPELRPPEAGTPEAMAALREALNKSEGAPVVELERVRSLTLGPFETFLLAALTLIVEGKTMGYTALLTQAAQGIPDLAATASDTLDDLAAHLAAKVEAGLLGLEEALPFLELAFHTPMGGDGLLVSYLSLLPLEERPRLDRLLEEPDKDRRQRCIEALGAREDDRLVPFFLKAMNDPVREVGMIAIHQIGKLPSGFEAMMSLFRSGQLDRMREAIHFFGENHTQAAAKPLMGFLASESPDDLLVDAAKALGNICDPATAGTLLTQLHSGKPLLLQVALADALGRLETPAASLGLLKKAEVLIFPQVLILALKGALSAFPSFEKPFPPENLPALEHLAELCCDPREGAGQWITVVLIMQDLFTFEQGAYVRLADRFSHFLSEMPLKTPREREHHDRVLDTIKKLTRRAENLARMEEREQLLQTLVADFSGGTGEKRWAALDQLRGLLADPWLILGPGATQELAAFLRAELARGVKDGKESAALCELIGLADLSDLVEPLRDLFTHTSNEELRLAARKAMQDLGLTENQIEGRAPIKRVLVLEPNAFFRKRLAAALDGKGRTLALAADRQEAGALLAAGPVDLLVTEIQDAQGDMGAWIEQAWDQRQCRYVLLSASNHNPAFLSGKSWVIGRLYKPYPMEELVRAIDG